MTTNRDPDVTIAAWLDDGPNSLPSITRQVVVASIHVTPQRRKPLIRLPWRFPIMTTPVRVGVAAVIGLLLLGAGIYFFGPAAPSGVGGAPSTEPSPSPSPSPSATGRPTPSPASAPPLTQSFTSTLHGVSVSYPEGWIAQPATEPWTDSTFSLSFGGPHADFLYDPALRAELFLTIASQPIGDATPEDWVAEQMASDEGCGTVTLPIVVDGADGLIGTGDCDVAVATTAGRGYWIQLYTGGDDPAAVAPYTRAWFEEVLATVQLEPESSPAPSP